MADTNEEVVQAAIAVLAEHMYGKGTEFIAVIGITAPHVDDPDVFAVCGLKFDPNERALANAYNVLARHMAACTGEVAQAAAAEDN